MVPLPPPEESPVRALGARRMRPGTPTTPTIVRTLRELGKESPALVALFDAHAIAGERHLLSAWAHLGRARGRGESRLRDRGAEFALFVAGDDQLPRALAKVGVSESTEQFVLVTERPHDPELLLARFELAPDPSAYPRPVDVALLDRLGIEAAERSAVPSSGWEGLVLERVALLDLSAPAAHPAAEKH
ncbi:MAG: KEOPS complex subunit Cgi121 [Thermoplasmata archaeon]|jgi:tRNA threonylcarbamoyladenosine modification (KEOPS) complex Cgi121 subunit